ncbi:MAG: alkylhydroperoxidase [Planctomycetota bacterium]
MIRYLEIRRYLRDPLVRQVCAQMRREFGLCAEPVLLHATIPELCAGVWSALRETLVAGDVPRAWKERVAAEVSRVNACPYCVEAHEMMLAGCGAAANGPDAQSAPLEAWVRSSAREPASAIAPRTPFDFDALTLVELRATAFCFHYINRVVTVFLGDSPIPVEHRWLKGGARRVSSWYFATRVRRRRARGASLAPHESSELPAELAWAHRVPSIADALARLCRAIELAAEARLSAEVRAQLAAAIGVWNGAPLAMTADLGAACLNSLGATDRRLAAFGLTTALAPHRISPVTIAELRAVQIDDALLLATAAFGSLKAALRIASWG